MPLIKSAIKKLRRDNKRRIENRSVIVTVKKAIKEAKIAANADTMAKAYSVIDKAVKKGLIKKNTAARKKSQIAKVLANAGTTAPKETKTTVKKAAKTTTSKTAPKKTLKSTSK